MSETNPSGLIGGSPGRRKLIAVVYADMVGYSRLIGLDDVGTLDRLRSLRRNVIDRVIEEHGGGSFRLVAIPSLSCSTALTARCAVPSRCNSKFRYTTTSRQIELFASASGSTLATRLPMELICTGTQ